MSDCMHCEHLIDRLEQKDEEIKQLREANKQLHKENNQLQLDIEHTKKWWYEHLDQEKELSKAQKDALIERAEKAEMEVQKLKQQCQCCKCAPYIPSGDCNDVYDCKRAEKAEAKLEKVRKLACKLCVDSGLTRVCRVAGNEPCPAWKEVMS